MDVLLPVPTFTMIIVSLTLAATLLHLVPLTLTYKVTVFFRSSCSASDQANNLTVQRAVSMATATVDPSDPLVVTVVDACDVLAAGQALLATDADAIVGPGDRTLCDLFFYMASLHQQQQQGGVTTTAADERAGGIVYLSINCLLGEPEGDVDSSSIVWMQPSVDETATAVAKVLATYRWHTVAIAYSSTTFYRNVASQLFIMLTSANYNVVFISKLPASTDTTNNMTSYVRQYANLIQSVKGKQLTLVCSHKN